MQRKNCSTHALKFGSHGTDTKVKNGKKSCDRKIGERTGQKKNYYGNKLKQRTDGCRHAV